MLFSYICSFFSSLTVKTINSFIEIILGIFAKNIFVAYVLHQGSSDHNLKYSEGLI